MRAAGSDANTSHATACGPSAQVAASARMKTRERESNCRLPCSTAVPESHRSGGRHWDGWAEVTRLTPSQEGSRPTRVGHATADVARYAGERGVIVLTYGIFGNAVRILPPLVISNELLPEGLQDFAEALHKFA